MSYYELVIRDAGQTRKFASTKPQGMSEVVQELKVILSNLESEFCEPQSDPRDEALVSLGRQLRAAQELVVAIGSTRQTPEEVVEPSVTERAKARAAYLDNLADFYAEVAKHRKAGGLR